MKENELLPIGTVVLLKEAEKKIMIFGLVVLLQAPLLM